MKAILRYGPFTHVVDVPDQPPYNLSIPKPQPRATMAPPGESFDPSKMEPYRLNFVIRRIIQREYVEYDYEGES